MQVESLSLPSNVRQFGGTSVCMCLHSYVVRKQSLCWRLRDYPLLLAVRKSDKAIRSQMAPFRVRVEGSMEKLPSKECLLDV